MYLKSLFQNKGHLRNNAEVPLTERVHEFIEEQRLTNQWEKSTVKMMITLKHHLESFHEAASLDYFDAEGINHFVRYLRSSACLEETTVRKHYKNLIWLLNWAVRKGYLDPSMMLRNKQKFKIVRKPVIFLSKKELLKLYHFIVPPTGAVVTLKDMDGNQYEKRVTESAALSRAKDLFCFCAFTSLRYSDMAKLCRSDIDENYIYVTTQKTHDRIPIDLNSYSRAILAKYADKQYKKNRALPVITNQQMNRCLKILCELCGFNEPIRIVKYCNGKRIEEVFPKYMRITTHCARKTFICYALAAGVPPVVVMRWTGHSDYKSMRPYIEIASEEKTAAMQLINQSLEKFDK